MAGWMEGGHARPAGERRKDTDAGSAASWRALKATQPERHHRASSTTPPANHLPPFKRQAPYISIP
jgi:hypothetical protein